MRVLVYPHAMEIGGSQLNAVETGAALRDRGHEVTVQAPWSLGRISAVARRGGMLYGAANPRGMQGYAVGR